MRTSAVLAGCVVALTPLLLGAQGQVANRPNFSGYWELRLDSFSVPTASLTPQAAANVEARRKSDAAALAQCANVGMPAIMNDGATLNIRQSTQMIAVIAKSPSSVRYIYTDGRARPPYEEVDLTTNGLSIGRWEGDTLVVETGSLNNVGVTQVPGGGYRTRNAKLTERFRLLENGQRLSVTFTWDDSTVFQKPHTYEYRYYRVPMITEPRSFRCFQTPDRAQFLTGVAPPAGR